MRNLLFFLLLPCSLVAREWTMLVYMAADNDLAQWADSDLVEMERFGSNEDVNVVIQIDKPSIGCRRMFVGNGSSVTLEEMGPIDMCAWETLADFIFWGITNFPAERHIVILWDHGSGWTTIPNRSYGSDWSHGSVLSIASGDFRQALSAAHEYTDTRIDILSFDACLMQQIEVAYEARDHATLMVAPQSVMPLPGFRYDNIIGSLHAEPGMNASGLARIIIQSTVDNYSDSVPIAVSAVSIAKTSGLIQELIAVENELMEQPPTPVLQAARQTVQTIPGLGCTPYPTDDLVDLGDLIRALDGIYAQVDLNGLNIAYAQTIVHAEHWGDAFGSTTGLTVWFPDVYVQFKQLLGSYGELDWTISNWLEFLNWFYDSDDIRPTACALTGTGPASDNDFRLHWTRSLDLAPVRYNVVEATGTAPVFSDACEDSSLWDFSGFVLSSANPHTGNASFFSGNASDLAVSIETKANLVIEELGALSIFLHYNTEEMADSLVIEYGPFRDVHYGYSGGWTERMVVLPAGDHPLRISYYTNGSINEGGCYIDDVTIQQWTGGRFIRRDLQDTVLYVYNRTRGDYRYAVYAEDLYGNTGDLSAAVGISLAEYAAPYSVPNPFQASCQIVIDHPDSLNPSVEIYSMAGARLRRFAPGEIVDHRVWWDGRDDGGREVGSGLYFVLIKDGAFKKLGKIARQR